MNLLGLSGITAVVLAILLGMAPATYQKVEARQQPQESSWLALAAPLAAEASQTIAD